METFSDRVRFLREKLGFSQKLLARKIGKSQATIGHIENGRNKTFKDILVLAEALQTTPEYLINGEESKELISKYYIESDCEHVKILPLSFNKYKGVDMSKFEEITSRPSIPLKFIEKNKLNLNNLFAMETHNDDMAPLIPNEAHVVIDVSKTEKKEGGVFMIERNGEMIMRRLKIDKDGSWICKCDNNNNIPEYDDLFLLPGDRIDGRVIWHSSNSGV